MVAPTDPVLASDVQTSPRGEPDVSEVRLALTTLVLATVILSVLVHGIAARAVTVRGAGATWCEAAECA